MRCVKCGNRDGPCLENNRDAKVFYIHLRANFEEYSNVPCHIRKKIHRASGYILPVKSDDEETYMFDLKKRDQKTRIQGADYIKFLHDFRMEHKEIVKFEFIKNEPYISIIPLDRDGVPKDIIEEEEDYDFEDHARAIVFTGDLKPTASQIAHINMCAQEHGLGLGGVFVHKMTKTDISSTGLRIPKEIASILCVPRNGWARLVTGGAAHIDAKYSKLSDGRMYFKTGWAEFVRENNIKIGEIVLVLFYLINDVFYVSFDYL